MRFDRIYILLLTLLISSSLVGQENIKNLLLTIEGNNPAIQALKAQFEFAKADACSELTPPNPNIEGGIFPAVGATGTKYAWGVSQSFEFPTVYAKRLQYAKATDKYANDSYNIQRQEILLDALQTFYEHIHAKKMLTESKHRETFARAMLNVIQKKVDVGQSSIIDLNNARLRVVEANQKVKEFEAKVMVLERKIIALNGGQGVALNDTIFVCKNLPKKDSIISVIVNNDFRFKSFSSLVEVAQNQKNLVVHQGLPELNIGYQSEKTDMEHFAGIKAGISIPLWGNIGKRNAAIANLNAAKVEQKNQQIQIESEIDAIYTQALSTKSMVDDLKKALSSFSNVSPLRRALEAGQISVLDFFNEVTYLYSISDRVQELELEYAKLFAELHRFEL